MIYRIAAILVLATSSLSQQPAATDGIVRNDFDGPNPDGSYRWALQTEEGIFHEQRGSLQGPGQSLKVEGQYQYTAPDGQIINVLYTADETGFHATGDHLPTPPPIPQEIQRSLDFIARAQGRG